MAARNIIRLTEAEKPEYTPTQMDFCADLIGLGLTRLTITALVNGKDTEKLNHAEVNSGNRLIQQVMKNLGYGVMDARRAQTPYMAAAVQTAAKKYKLSVRIA